jgi:hypothetical protein
MRLLRGPSRGGTGATVCRRKGGEEEGRKKRLAEKGREE